MGPWNSSGALVCFEFAIVLPCEGGVVGWDGADFPVTLGGPISTGHG